MRDSDCSVFVGNLDQDASEEVLWELFLQAGPIKSIHIPCDKDTGKQRAFAFIEFSSSASAHYAWELLDGIRLYNRSLTVRPQNLENSQASGRMPSNMMPAHDFYNDFYNKYEEVKRRPQSEPRRNQWNENHQRNSSFNYPTLNRSLSSPSYMVNTSPQMQQLLSMFTSASNSSTPYRGSPRFGYPNEGSPSYGRSPSYSGTPSSDSQCLHPSQGYHPPQGYNPQQGYNPPTRQSPYQR